jgi:hypothetical protein
MGCGHLAIFQALPVRDDLAGEASLDLRGLAGRRHEGIDKFGMQHDANGLIVTQWEMRKGWLCPVLDLRCRCERDVTEC